MKQSLVGLPKEADFRICGWHIVIRDHIIENSIGLFGMIKGISQDSNSDRQTLLEFEKHKISYEAAIEELTRELEDDVRILADIIHAYNRDDVKSHCNIVRNTWNRLVKFSTTLAGRNIADQFVDKIRRCHNWEELYDEMQGTSRFNRYIIKKYRRR